MGWDDAPTRMDRGFALMTDWSVIKERGKGDGKLSGKGDRSFSRFIVWQCFGVCF